MGAGSAERAVENMRKFGVPKLGPKGRPIAETRWQDELPKILKEFEIHPPQTLRFWKQAKLDYGLIEQRVAYIREVMAKENAERPYWQSAKTAPEYAGLLISLIFPKKKV